MGMTLYFAKLNLVSDDVFRLYDNPGLKNEISGGLYEAVRANQRWEKENIYIDDAGDPHSSIIEYSIHILREDNTLSYIEGWLYKKSRLYYKILDDSTNRLLQQYTENTEGIRFTLDVNHGLVGYNTSRRFGYREFIAAFETLINLGEEACNLEYRYNMSQCTSGINLDDIKQGLNSIGRIKELKIRMQPPNPSDDLLEDIKDGCDGLVEEFKKANVTEAELLYSTKGASGINLQAPFISKKIEDIQGLHSKLSVEESTKKRLCFR